MGIVFTVVVLFLNYKLGKKNKTHIKTLINDRGASLSSNIYSDEKKDADNPQDTSKKIKRISVKN